MKQKTTLYETVVPNSLSLKGLVHGEHMMHLQHNPDLSHSSLLMRHRGSRAQNHKLTTDCSEVERGGESSMPRGKDEQSRKWDQEASQ